MTDLILPSAVAVPLVVVLLLVPRMLRRHACAFAPWAALPAVAAVLILPTGTTVELPWLLFGSRLTLDHTARVFLLFSATLWLLSGVFARTYVDDTGDGQDTGGTGGARVAGGAGEVAGADLSAVARSAKAEAPALHSDGAGPAVPSDPGGSATPSGSGQPRFWLFHLLTMAGSLGVVVAGDVITFYTCFALLGFASYGLIVHYGDEAARRAGRVYIGFVVVGELLLFVGIVGLAALTGSTAFPVLSLDDPRATTLRWLVFAGFGIKAGIVPLHMWLPLAHPAAPVPASAVLSGVIIKAGLLGWLRFLPLGVHDMPVLGTVCVLLGMVAAFGGVLIGLTQREPKAALAYSSVSQMGIVTSGIGGGLLVPAAWPMLAPAILLYAVHHAFAKAALFLAVGVATHTAARTRKAVVLAATVPALTLAGLPFTSGAAAKLALKQAMYDVPVPVLTVLTVLLSVAAVGTTLLMARVLFLLREVPGHAADHAVPGPDERASLSATHGRPALHRHSHTAPPARGLVVPWALALAAVSGLGWLLPWPGFRDVAMSSVQPTHAWDALWPLATGAGLAWLVWRRPHAVLFLADVRVPPGDLIEIRGRAVPVLMRAGEAIGRAHAAMRGAARHFMRSLVPAHVGRVLVRVEQRMGEWATAGVLLLCVLLLLASAAVRP